MSSDPTAAAAAFVRLRSAMAVDGLTGSEKGVLLVLSIMANASGVAWPSVTQIAARASIGRRTAFEALDRLAALGLIDREAVPGKGARYTLPPDWCAPRTSAPAAPVRHPHSTGAPAAPKQPRTTRGNKTTSSYLDAGASERAWNAYDEMRRKMAKGPRGRPWTTGAQDAALRSLTKLAAAGHAPDDVLDQSVLNGWQGLFPVKGARPGADDMPTIAAAHRAMAMIQPQER